MQYGGVVHTIPYQGAKIIDYTRGLYLYVRKNKQILKKCFIPIKDFILNFQVYNAVELYFS